jgi:hypothetical protein
VNARYIVEALGSFLKILRKKRQESGSFIGITLQFTLPPPSRIGWRPGV